MDGHSEDVTSKVGWSSQFTTLTVVRGVANVRAPGVFPVTAVAGSINGMAQLTATFQGNLMGNGFDPSGQSTLDGTVGGATQIAYPLDRSIFPPNLSPVTMHIAKTSGQSAARINFSVDPVVNVNYYALCQPGAGTGCYVDLPLELTQLFVAVSESKDVQVTARVGGLGATSDRVGADQHRLGQRAAVRRPLLLDDAGHGGRPRLHATQQRRQHAGDHRDRHPALRLRQGRRDRAAAGLHRSRARADVPRLAAGDRPTTPSASAATPSAATARPWR